jgi:hypothetical protein
MPKKLKYITIPLQISSFLIALSIIFLIVLLYLDESLGIFLFWESRDGLDLVFRLLLIFNEILSVGFIVVPIIVASALKKRKRWAWIASWCLMGLYLPSLFFPLGLPMLIGILDKEVKEFFADDKRRQSAARQVE